MSDKLCAFCKTLKSVERLESVGGYSFCSTLCLSHWEYLNLIDNDCLGDEDEEEMAMER